MENNILRPRPEDILLTAKEVRQMLGCISQSTLYRLYRVTGALPEPIKLRGSRTNYWRLSDVQKAIDDAVQAVR